MKLLVPNTSLNFDDLAENNWARYLQPSRDPSACNMSLCLGKGLNGTHPRNQYPHRNGMVYLVSARHRGID